MEDNFDNLDDNMQERYSQNEENELGDNIVNSNSIDNIKTTHNRGKLFNKLDNGYHEMLENKIREQAQRLLELQNYKNLCEKRIKQLSPCHLFPVTEKHIQQHSQIETNINEGEVVYLSKQVSDLKSLLQLKDQDIMQQMRKYDTLESKYNKIIADSIPKNKVVFMRENKNNYNFPSVEKIPNEKIREAYSKLCQSMKELIYEKEQILDNLKRETIDNEEQRNYIEILKQTIDTTITKLNIGGALNNQKVNYQDRRNVSNIEVLIDFTKLKNEADKYKKDYLLSNIIINELKQEIEKYKKANEEMRVKKEKINETLESGILELEHAKNKVINLEEEKEVLAQELEGLKVEYENVINDYNMLLKEYEKMKDEYTSYYESSNKIELEKNQECENLTKKNNEMTNDLKNLEEKNISLKNSNEELINSQKENKNLIEEINNNLNVLKKEKNDLSNEKEELIQKVNELKEIEKEKDFFKNEYEKLHSNYEYELKTRDDEIEELIKNMENFKEKLSEFKKEMISKDEEIKKIKDLIKEKDFNIKDLTERVEELQKIDKKFELFQNETNELLNELNYYKTLSEDYSKTIKSLNENFKIKDDKSQNNKNINNSLNYSQELEHKFNSLNKKNEEYAKIIQNYEIEIGNNQSYCKKLEEEIDILKAKEKDNQKLQNLYNDIKIITNSILNLAKNLNHKIIINQEPDENNKTFLDNINQFKFSIIQLNNINFLEVFKSVDNWITVVCSELEVVLEIKKDSLNKIKELESIVKDLQLKSQNLEKYSKHSLNDENENENRRLKLQIKQLLDEIGFLRSDHEIIRKKYEKLSRENKTSRTDIKIYNEEHEKFKNEVNKV